MNELFFYFSVLLSVSLALAGTTLFILAFMLDKEYDAVVALVGALLVCAGIACSYVTVLLYDDMVVRCEKCGHIIFLKD